MKIIRVFPRKTAATPDDINVRIAKAPGWFDEADEVHISVSWTYDIPLAERLATLWRHVAPVTVGGPAYDDPGGVFIPGMYVKKGYVMTSRGCPNSCWFCSAWKREGHKVRELPLTEGYNLLDSNILACSDEHIKNVFAMLMKGKKKYHKPIEFTGGLEAKRLKQWHVDDLRRLNPKQLFFAYDTPDDLEPLQVAGEMLLAAGWTKASHTLRAYVLCGYKGDTIAAVQERIKQTVAAGFLPSAMLYRDEKGVRDLGWQRWARQYSRAAISASKKKKQGG